ncbi:hypothetical protein FE257_010690 [Aspergillus nanangensis]|uniref:FAD/NAD(P)-binding domain-containing protein n=1 Tax=Aspergillus nanangensis TaxID=2582783 RepID=A0AAD4GR18_ASPNN|nr:hypothetical protein FE257_010690 [Aspergillus nanangensis]
MTSVKPTPSIHCDVLIVGAGFSGMYGLHKLRQLGLGVKVFEAAGDFGGVWYWNRYPGARVDSEWPFYQLSIPEVWESYNFSCRFPDHNEIREYFAHVDRVLDLRKDIYFNSRVNHAEWLADEGRWLVQTENGHVASCKYLLLFTGLLQRKHLPEFPGIQDYQGTINHSVEWPQGLDVSGKRVGVIGAGATSVQIVQELSKPAAQLSIFMRRPSLCLPLKNRPITAEENANWKPYFETLFREGRKSSGMWEVTEAEREAYYEHVWEAGSFHFGAGNYRDIWVDLKANWIAYDFWARKTRARITNSEKRDLMAPLEPPFPILTKRSPLEHDYYECLDQENVSIVDLNAAPLKEFTTNGIRTADGKVHEFDHIVFATGFDNFTGSICNMGLKSKDGVDMKDVWGDSIATYLGMLVHGFPNCFLSYSPQSPMALSNGPTILECQVDFIVECIARLESEGAQSIEATAQSQEDWKKLINEMSAQTLFPLTTSWWTRSNAAGVKPEMLTYIAGIGQYEAQCRETLDGWKGFTVVPGGNKRSLNPTALQTATEKKDIAWICFSNSVTNTAA